MGWRDRRVGGRLAYAHTTSDEMNLAHDSALPATLLCQEVRDAISPSCWLGGNAVEMIGMSQEERRPVVRQLGLRAGRNLRHDRFLYLAPVVDHRANDLGAIARRCFDRAIVSFADAIVARAVEHNSRFCLTSSDT